MDFNSGQKDAKQGLLPRFPGQLHYMQGWEAGAHYRRLAEIQRIRNLDAIKKAREERLSELFENAPRSQAEAEDQDIEDAMKIIQEAATP